jgi:hypothetical protein
MLQLENRTPFAAGFFVLPDTDGVDTVYVAVKATFSLGRKGIALAEAQRPLTLVDDYWGEPGRSSLKYASEVHLLKSASDIALVGSAYAPGGRPVACFDARLKVGHLEKMTRVHGDRVWEKGVFGPSPSKPIPLKQVPVVWERAYGGRYEVPGEDVKLEPRNPVGRGFRGGRSAKETEGLPLPNLELPGSPLKSWKDRPVPAGFGFIAGNWEPRIRFAGTYDSVWQESRAPFLPEDFDARFLNAVPEDQVYPGFLKGGEPVELENLSPDGGLRFALPHVELGGRARIAGTAHGLEFALETLLIEPDERRFCLTWRASVSCDKKSLAVELIEVEARRIEGAAA